MNDTEFKMKLAVGYVTSTQSHQKPNLNQHKFEAFIKGFEYAESHSPKFHAYQSEMRLIMRDLRILINDNEDNYFQRMLKKSLVRFDLAHAVFKERLVNDPRMLTEMKTLV